MSYEISIKKSALKELHSLSSIALESVCATIDSLATNPRPIGCKKLKGENAIIWRIRVGNYRIFISLKMM